MRTELGFYNSVLGTSGVCKALYTGLLPVAASKNSRLVLGVFDDRCGRSDHPETRTQRRQNSRWVTPLGLGTVSQW